MGLLACEVGGLLTEVGELLAELGFLEPAAEGGEVDSGVAGGLREGGARAMAGRADCWRKVRVEMRKSSPFPLISAHSRSSGSSSRWLARERLGLGLALGTRAALGDWARALRLLFSDIGVLPF